MAMANTADTAGTAMPPTTPLGLTPITPTMRTRPKPMTTDSAEGLTRRERRSLQPSIDNNGKVGDKELNLLVAGELSIDVMKWLDS